MTASKGYSIEHRIQLGSGLNPSKIADIVGLLKTTQYPRPTLVCLVADLDGAWLQLRCDDCPESHNVWCIACGYPFRGDPLERLHELSVPCLEVAKLLDWTPEVYVQLALPLELREAEIAGMMTAIFERLLGVMKVDSIELALEYE